MTKSEKFLKQFPMDASLCEVFKYASALAKASKMRTIDVQHLVLALMLLTNSFDELFRRKIDRYPACADVILDKAKMIFEQDHSIASSFVFSDAVIGILDPTSPGSVINRVLSPHVIKQLSPIHVAYAVAKALPEFLRVILLEHGLPNNESAVSDIVDDQFTRYADNRSTQEKKEWRKSIVASLRELLHQNFVNQEALVEKVCYSVNLCLQRQGNASADTDGSVKTVGILIAGVKGSDKRKLARCIEMAFYEHGLQRNKPWEIHVETHVHRESFEFALLGDQQSYKQAQPGILYTATNENPYGVVRFENIDQGNPQIAPLIESFMTNPPQDHFWNKTIISSNNLVVCTMTISSETEAFITKAKKLSPEALREALVGIDNESFTSRTSSFVDKDNRHLLPLLGLMDSIIVLDTPNETTARCIAEAEFDRYKKSFEQRYNVTFENNDEESFYKMIVHSDSQSLSPEMIRMSVHQQVTPLEMSLMNHDEITRVSIRMGTFPHYEFPIERRTKRGDYIEYDLNQKIEGESLELEYTNLHYSQTPKRKLNDWLTMEVPDRIPRPIGVDFAIEKVEQYIMELTDSRFFRKDAPFRRTNKGILLSGPPGNGKTTLIRYCAFNSKLPIIRLSAAQLTLENISQSFRIAREYGPVLFIIEEVDSLLNRGIIGSHIMVINELLQQIDGISTDNPFLIIATSNYSENLDKALVRPGRLGEKLELDLPNDDARLEYLKVFCQNPQRNIALTDLDQKRFVAQTDQMSYATLEKILQDTGLSLQHQNIECFSELFVETMFKIIDLHMEQDDQAAKVIGFNIGNAGRKG